MAANRPARGPLRLTARGVVTRDRIVEAAAELMYEQGVGATTLDQVVQSASVSKSQFYHYFADKDALVSSVIQWQSRRTISVQEPYFSQLDSIQGFERWRDFLVRWHRTGHTPHGCRVGSLANEVADSSEAARILLAATFRTWQSYLVAGLVRMRESGELDPDVNPDDLATAMMAALEGGYLLAKTAHDTHPFELALDMAISYLRAYLSTSGAAT